MMDQSSPEFLSFVNLFSSSCVVFVVGRSSTEPPSARLCVTILSLRISSRLLSSQCLRCSPNTRQRFLNFLTPTFQYAVYDRAAVRPPLGSTRVAEPSDDRLGALRGFSGEHAVRRIGHRGSALSGGCILHIAQENGSTGRHLFPTSRRSRKDSGPSSTVSLVVGWVDERLRTYHRFLRRYSWSTLQPNYRRSGVLLRTSLHQRFL